MSNATLPRLPRVLGAKKTFAIIGSLYNEDYVNAMIEAAQTEIQLLTPTTATPIYRVPGAYEIPVCAEFVTRRTKADVIIALGVVIRGQTGHADIVANSVADSLQDISRQHLTPIINEVLLLNNEEQARERCYGTRMNRGTEAARAAASMAELFDKLESAFPADGSKTRSKA